MYICLICSFAIALATGEITTLVEGSDFYTSPRLSPDGQQLAFISWDHPNMPWDSSYLWLMNLESGSKELVAGGTKESISEPKWSPEGKLYFSSDHNDWWNLYCRNHDGMIECLHQMPAEFAYPHWVFGLSTYSFVGDNNNNNNNIVCAYSQNGRWYLGIIDRERGSLARGVDTNIKSIDIKAMSIKIIHFKSICFCIYISIKYLFVFAREQQA